MAVTGRAGAAGLVLVVLALGACGGGSGEPAPGESSSTAPFNQADVDFAVAMSMHRGQALSLAEVAGTRSKDPTARRILARIRASEATAVDVLGGWMQEWARAGIEVPHDHSEDGGTAPGMLSQRQMSKVAGASARTFDVVLLTALIAHHRAAMQLFAGELTTGRSTKARGMAEELAQLYRSELDAMQRAVGEPR